MRIQIKEVVRPIYLSEYAEEYEDQKIMVWVNPPRSFRQEHADIVDRFKAVLDERVAIGQELEAAKAQNKEPVQDYSGRLKEIYGLLEGMSDELYTWYARLWSKHSDPETHWTTTEVTQFVEACVENDPPLWDWVQQQVWDALRAHTEGSRKN